MPLRGERPDRPTYQVVNRLPGGKGLVVVADHQIFGRLCVQKTVEIRGLGGDLAFFEPRLLDRVDHPHITPIDEVQFDPVHDNAVTFIMPLYDGGSAHGALEEGHRFSLGTAMTIAADILSALAYLHNLGFVHRDVKPGNILMQHARDRGFLCDFGSAARLEADGLAPAIVATLPYVPPEALPYQRVGPQGDVYGLSMSLYELLSGRLPWEQFDAADAQMRLMKGRRAISERHLERWAPHVPDRLRRAVRKGLREDPSGRFSSARDFLNALMRIECIDWRHLTGQDLGGEWVGTWPPRLPVSRRTEYRVTSRELEAGKHRGRRRLEAHYRRKGITSWRRALSDATVDRDDASAVTQFFDAVAAKAAHRSPAR